MLGPAGFSAPREALRILLGWDRHQTDMLPRELSPISQGDLDGSARPEVQVVDVAQMLLAAVRPAGPPPALPAGVPVSTP